MKKVLFTLFGLLLYANLALSQTTTSAVPPPRCMIDQFTGNFHSGVSSAGDVVAIIWCDDQLGLTYWTIAGNKAQALSNTGCLNGVGAPSWSLAWIQAAWTACTTLPLTQDQITTATALANLWVPRLNVTDGANRNVYTANVDGTRGPQLVVGGFGMQVAPGTGCNGKRLTNAGARYNDVSGKVSTNGVTLPSGSYAQCTITYAPAVGWST